MTNPDEKSLSSASMVKSEAVKLVCKFVLAALIALACGLIVPAGMLLYIKWDLSSGSGILAQFIGFALTEPQVFPDGLARGCIYGMGAVVAALWMLVLGFVLSCMVASRCYYIFLKLFGVGELFGVHFNTVRIQPSSYEQAHEEDR